MRGIVAETNKKYAIILAQDGSFRKIKAAAYMTVGSEIDLNQPTGNVKVSRLMTKISAIAAAALFIMGIGYGAYSYTVPYSYVDVDINPSIELTVNVYDRIITTEALNDDGKKLLDNKNLKNLSLKAGVSQLLNTALDLGYLKAENVNSNTDKNGTVSDNRAISSNTSISESGLVIENAVLLTVSSLNEKKSGELKKELAVVASKELEKGSVKSEVLVGEASVKQRDDARRFGVTPGKLALIEDAMEGEPELKLDELKKAPVKDLIKKAKDKKADEDKQKADEDKQKVSKEKEKDNSTGKNGKNGENTIDQKGVTVQIEQGAKQEQTTVMEQLPEQLASSDKNEEAAQNNGNDKLDNSSNNGKNNNNGNNGKSNNNINGNSDDKGQDTAEILKREKQQMQQLRDELLEQLQDRKQLKENDMQQEKKQQISDDNGSTKYNEGKNGTKKNQKDASQQTKRN